MVMIDSGRIKAEYGYDVHAAAVGGRTTKIVPVREELAAYLSLIGGVIERLNLNPQEVKAGDANLGFRLGDLRKNKYDFTGKTFAEIQKELKEMNIARKVTKWHYGKKEEDGWSRGTDFEHFIMVGTPIFGLERLFSTPYTGTTGTSQAKAYTEIMANGDLKAGALLQTKINTNIGSYKVKRCMTEGELKGKDKEVSVDWDVILFYKRK